jgi:15-cis-phytoene synthase
MQHSQAITRKSASNLALAFILLPRPKREAMAVLYAFCREVDDATDEDSIPVSARRETLAAWRADVQRACARGQPEFPVNQELQPVIRQFGLRFELFDELLKGCETDLEQTRYETWERLETYCYRVASVVGLLSLEIFGYQNARSREYAIALGHALQLTNILRDVQNDAARGRIYLPRTELEKFSVTEAEILRGEYSERYAQLAASAAARARQHYCRARKLLPPEDRRAMVAAEMMGAVYWRLLRRLEARNFDVFTPRTVRLSKPHKFALVLRAVWRHLWRTADSDYATA